MTAAPAIPTDLWTRFQQDHDPEARAALIDQHLGLVHHIARQVANRIGGAVEFDELLSAGSLGLVTAMQSFDPDRGLAFTTYATPRIRGAILDELRSRDWVPRSVRTKARRLQEAVQVLETQLGRTPHHAEIALALGIDIDTYWRWREDIDGGIVVPFHTAVAQPGYSSASLEELISDPDQGEPIDPITAAEEVTVVRNAIAELPTKERTVLALYYYEGLNLRQIAQILELTESRISQIRSQALKRLRSTLTPALVA